MGYFLFVKMSYYFLDDGSWDNGVNVGFFKHCTCDTSDKTWDGNTSRLYQPRSMTVIIILWSNMNISIKSRCARIIDTLIPMISPGNTWTKMIWDEVWDEKVMGIFRRHIDVDEITGVTTAEASRSM